MSTTKHRKLRELILYLARRSEGDETFAKTKLYKLLFYVDFGAFASLGHSITGEEYKRWPQGPVPPAAEDVLTDLEKEGRLAMAERPYFGREQLRPMALREPDLSLFSGPEIALVNQVIQEHWGRSARGVSDLSHEFIGWRIARPGEAIPYETVLVDNSPPTEDEIQYAESLIAAGR